MRRTFAFLAIVLLAVTLRAASPEVIPVRLVSFDPTIQKMGKAEVQTATLELLEGRKTGTTFPVRLYPSRQTARFVGEKLYLRIPLSRLKAKGVTFIAGEVLDLEPAVIASGRFTTTVPFKEGKAEPYFAARFALDSSNEINGVVTPPADPTEWLTDAQAIALATKVDPDAVRAAVTFTVQAIGHADGLIWLNSAPKYWTSQSLNVGIPPHVAADFKLRHKAAIDSFLQGRKVVISGVVQRVKILKQGSEDFYYQTQMTLWSAHQIKIVE